MRKTRRVSTDSPAKSPAVAPGPAELYRATDDIARELRTPRSGQALGLVAGRAAHALERIAGLHKASLVFSSAQTLDEVVRVALGQGLVALDAAAGYLALLSADGVYLRTRQQRLPDTVPGPWTEHTIQDDGPLAAAIEAEQLLIYPVEDERVGRHPGLQSGLQEVGAHTLVVLPLSLGERKLGALGFAWRQNHDFTDEEQAFVSAFALQCTLALDRVRLMHAERAARERAVVEARKNAELLESMSDGFVAFDRQMRFLYVNRAATEIAGRPASAVLGRSLDEVYAAPATPFGAAARRAIETGEPFSLEFETPLVQRWLEVRGFPTPEGISVIFRDVTARKLAEQRQQVLAEMSRIFDSGLNREVMLQRVAELIVPVIADSCTIELLEGKRRKRVAVAQAEPLEPIQATREAPLVARGERMGTLRIGLSVSRSRPQVSGFLMEVAHRVATAVDLARMYESERLARHDAEAANRAKSEFLAVMSHELRTPLNAIGGYAELMELGVHGKLGQEYHEFVARIRASEEHLLNLINSVLSFAKLEAGAVEFQIADVRVSDIVAGLEPLIRGQMEQKRLRYEVFIERALIAHADSDRVRQILLNLLSNAIKFTARGGSIVLNAQAQDGRCRITVSDTGTGIPRDKLDTIFDPFVQADRSLTRNAGGVGLGLAISRDLAVGMRGDLTVQSKVGVGSTFTLDLPCGARDRAAAA